MIKRTIEISRQPVHISTRLDQLIVQPIDQPKSQATSIPCEDIGILCVDQPRVSYSHAALQALMKFGASLVVCGPDHLPAGMLLPVSGHHEVVKRLQLQINLSTPRKKQLWKQIVIAKIRAQSRNIAFDPAAQKRLNALTRDVRSGDPGNVEAHAAKLYWQAWRVVPTFRRNPDGNDSVNVTLNYGYAVMRAAVARALVSAGLQPAIGLHHHHRANAFALADDLVEPLRPMIDHLVRQHLVGGRSLPEQLDQATKGYMLQVLSAPVNVGDESGPLMVGLQRYVASMVQCFQGLAKRIACPTAVDTES